MNRRIFMSLFALTLVFGLARESTTNDEVLRISPGLAEDTRHQILNELKSGPSTDGESVRTASTLSSKRLKRTKGRSNHTKIALKKSTLQRNRKHSADRLLPDQPKVEEKNVLKSPFAVYAGQAIKFPNFNVPFVVGGYLHPVADIANCNCKTFKATGPDSVFSASILYGYEHLLRMKHLAYFKHWIGELKKKSMQMSGWIVTIDTDELVHSEIIDNNYISVYPDIVAGQAPFKSIMYSLELETKKNTFKASEIPNGIRTNELAENVVMAYKFNENRYYRVSEVPNDNPSFPLKKYLYEYDTSSSFKNGSQYKNFNKLVGFHLIDEYPLDAVTKAAAQNQLPRTSPTARPKVLEKKVSDDLPRGVFMADLMRTPYVMKLTQWMINRFGSLLSSKLDGGCKKDLRDLLDTKGTVRLASMAFCHNKAQTQKFVSKHGAMAFRINATARKDPSQAGTASGSESAGGPKKFSFYLVYLITVQFTNAYAHINLYSASYFPEESEIQEENSKRVFRINLKSDAESSIPSFTDEDKHPIKFLLSRAGVVEDVKVCKNVITGIKFGLTKAVDKFLGTGTFGRTTRRKLEETQEQWDTSARSTETRSSKNLDPTKSPIIDQSEQNKAYRELAGAQPKAPATNNTPPAASGTGGNSGPEVSAADLGNQEAQDAKDEAAAEEENDAKYFSWCSGSKPKSSDSGSISSYDCQDLTSQFRTRIRSSPAGQTKLAHRFYSLIMQCAQKCTSETFSLDFMIPFIRNKSHVPILSIKTTIATINSKEKKIIQTPKNSSKNSQKSIIDYQDLMDLLDVPKEEVMYEVVEKVCFSIRLNFSNMYKGMFKCFTVTTDNVSKDNKDADNYMSHYDVIGAHADRFHMYLANMIRSQFTLDSVRRHIQELFGVADIQPVKLTAKFLLGFEMFGEQRLGPDDSYLYYTPSISIIVRSNKAPDIPIQVLILSSGDSTITVIFRVGTAQLTLSISRIFIAEVSNKNTMNNILNFKGLASLTDDLLKVETVNDEEALKVPPFKHLHKELEAHMSDILELQSEYFKLKFVPVIREWVEKTFTSLQNNVEADQKVMNEWEDRGFADSFMDAYSAYNSQAIPYFEKTSDITPFMLNIYGFDQVVELMSAAMKFLFNGEKVKLIDIRPTFKPNADVGSSNQKPLSPLDFEGYEGPHVESWGLKLGKDGSSMEWGFDEANHTIMELKHINEIFAALKERPSKHDFNHVMMVYGIKMAKSAANHPNEEQKAEHGNSKDFAFSRKLRVSLYEIKIGPMVLILVTYTTQYFMWEYMHGFDSYPQLWMQINESLQEVIEHYYDLAELDEKSDKHVLLAFEETSTKISKDLETLLKTKVCPHPAENSEANTNINFYVQVDAMQKGDSSDVKCDNAATNRTAYFRIASLQTNVPKFGKKDLQYVLQFYGMRLPNKNHPLDSPETLIASSFSSSVSHRYTFTAKNFDGYEKRIETYVRKAYENMFKRLVGSSASKSNGL
jgi:hypothetical protein